MQQAIATPQANFAILRDTPSLLIVHKPPNVPFHNDDLSAGAVTLLREQLGASYPRIYPTHRLDAMTSGALIFAKSPESARQIITAFREKAVEKYYVALSDRKPSKKQGSVVGDMTKARRGSFMLQRTVVNPSITRFLSTGVKTKTVPSEEQQQKQREGGGLRAFLIKPETGKTHQIRVAMKSLGSPVLGDVRYANAEQASMEQRGYLHCCAMRFSIDGAQEQVVCPPTDGAEFLTEEFQSVFTSWFPQGLENDFGTWFSDNKLLKSSVRIM